MKRFFISFCLSAAVLFSVVTILSSANSNKNLISENETYFSSKYIISDHNGKLAVYKNDSDIPVKIYNVFLENLPSSDQEEIKKGITCKDDAELRQLIEDYTS